MKAIADAPLLSIKEKECRRYRSFGPFIKWDGLLFNVNKNMILIIYRNRISKH
jgi:hypothetical protein